MARKILRPKALLLGLAVAFCFAQANAKPTVTISSNITTDTYWDSSHIYLLSGYIYVKNGATLTIQEGTLIEGAKSPLGALIITRSSKIMAVGSVGHPIVFTSQYNPGQRQRGDWGGVILLGQAPHNLGGAHIEGIVPNDDTWFGTKGAPDVYSNTNNDPHDNSGILKYVRIEFAGYALSPNNEINGLTFGSVGDGTTIDYVQVSYANDDSFEWFGGTVNCKHLIAFRGIDDDFDTDNGFSGKCQFLVSLRDPAVADQSQSAGFESDNNADGTDDTPITKAVFSNVDVIAGGDTVINALYKGGAHIRRNSGMYAINCIIQGWPQGLQIDGTKSHLRVKSDTLVMNSIVTVKSGDFDGLGGKWVVNAGTVDETTYPGLKNTVRNILLHLANNQFGTGNALTQMTDPYNLNTPNFILKSGSPALNASSWAAGNYHTVLNDPFFTPVTYIGAFSGNSFDDWTAGWANFNPTAGNTPKPVLVQNCAASGVAPKITTTFVQPVCKTGRINAAASGGKAPSGTPYMYVWGKVVAGDTLYTDTTTNPNKTELDSGTYTVRALLGVCISPNKVVKLARQLPKFAGDSATKHTLLVKLNLGNIYKYMSGYATQLRYKKVTDVNWSIWSGNNNQNVYYYGTTPKDSLWRWYDSTKVFTGTPNYNNHPLLTDATGKANYFNPASLLANKFVNLDSNSQYQFQMRGRCFTSTGVVVFSDTIMTSPMYKTLKVGAALMAGGTTADEVRDQEMIGVDVVAYPNPASATLNVKTTGFSSNGIVIKVTNMNGQVVYSSKQSNAAKQTNISINVSTLPSGTYMLEITDGTVKKTKQISVIK